MKNLPTVPSSPYSASKASADHLVKGLCEELISYLQSYLTVVIIMDPINFLKN